MPIKPIEPVAKPLALLKKFEAKMDDPEGVFHLSEALSVLTHTATDSPSAELTQ